MVAYYEIKKPKENTEEKYEEDLSDKKPSFLTPRKKPFVLLSREEREAEIRKSELEAKKATKPVGPVKMAKKVYEVARKPFVEISGLKKRIEEKRYKQIAKEIRESKERDKLMEIHRKERKKLDKKYVVKRDGKEVIPEEMIGKYEEERRALISRQEKELSLIGKLEKKEWKNK